METFIIYLAKYGVCLSVFLIIYILFLRSTTFYRFNRLFLISGFILSFIIPAIKYSYEIVLPSASLAGNTLPMPASETATASAVSIWSILFGLYCAGIFILMIRNLLSYTKLINLVRNGLRSDEDKIKVIESEKVNSPFTVLNYILLNSKKLSDIEKDLILKHEVTHIKQKHWLDLLCSECILLIQWFNPLAWLYVHLLKENHEFLADKAVIDSGVSPALYQAVLINQRFQGPVFSFSNSFNHTKPMNRLSMLKKTKSSPWKRICVLIIIPVFGLFIWASAVPRYVLAMEQPVLSETADSVNDKSQIYIYGIKNSTDNGIGDKINIEPKEGKPLLLIDGVKSQLAIEDLETDNIESMTIIKNKKDIEPYGKEAENGLILISTKKGNDFSPLPSGLINTKPVQSVDVYKDALLIIDGKIEPAEKMKQLNPDMIESIDVLKDETATNLYGEKGKNGVIKITTKK
ncbi:M56 family metallopeptidase [Dysgonomonas sp. 521]|uniref:M56 family metallopeptidase n=1 Tax=Dysgonomonas sp. 521 TaxID=2302932 RepID=UPI0013D31C77|nr:M56 family metallopeptidase [Dysgonomonas sp. 521]